MAKKTKKDTTKDKVEVVLDETTETEEVEETEVSKAIKENTELFSRIFYTVLFAFIGWVSLWVFGFVVLIQFGFLLITGKVNKNLKGFNQEVGLFLYDMIKYLSFQTDEKPFPFCDWPYGDETDNSNKTELNESQAVKASK